MEPYLPVLNSSWPKYEHFDCSNVHLHKNVFMEKRNSAEMFWCSTWLSQNWISLNPLIPKVFVFRRIQRKNCFRVFCIVERGICSWISEWSRLLIAIVVYTIRTALILFAIACGISDHVISFKFPVRRNRRCYLPIDFGEGGRLPIARTTLLHYQHRFFLSIKHFIRGSLDELTFYTSKGNTFTFYT